MDKFNKIILIAGVCVFAVAVLGVLTWNSLVYTKVAFHPRVQYSTSQAYEGGGKWKYADASKDCQANCDAGYASCIGFWGNNFLGRWFCSGSNGKEYCEAGNWKYTDKCESQGNDDDEPPLMME